MNISGDNIFRIKNENYGKTVATNGEYVAIGNPNPYDFDIVDGFSRIGEVYVYKKNINENEDYSLYFKCTSSLDYENTRGFYIPREIKNGTCDDELEDNTAYHYSLMYQSKYGNSIDIYKNIMVVGDYNCIVERVPCNNESFITFGKVDIYELSTDVTSGIYKKPICVLDPLINVSIDDSQRFGIRTSSYENDFCRGYGYSVAISGKHIFVGCPFSIDTSISYKNQRGDRNRHGVVFAYRYEVTTSGFKILNEFTPEIIVPSLEKFNGTSYKNFGYHISTNKSDLNPYNISSKQQVLISTHEESYSVNSENQLLNPSVYLFDYTEENQKLFILNRWNMTDSFYPTGSSSSNYSEFTDVYDTIEIETNLNETGLFGISSVINDNCIFIGAPRELSYIEYNFSENTLRHNRGCVYSYFTNKQGDYTFYNKIFGGKETFKDNLFGISLSIINQHQSETNEDIEKIAIGSPRLINNTGSIDLTSSKLHYSKFLYDTVDMYSHSTEENLFNELGFNGQVILYKISKTGCDINIPELKYLTTHPISSRKVLGESYNAFGYSVALSDINLVVGAPVLPFDNFISKELYETEEYGKDINATSRVYRVEDNILDTDDLTFSYEVESNPCPEIQGRGYIYNKNDLIENYIVGGVFYNNNRMVINTHGNICKDLFKLPNSNSDVLDLHGTINSRVTMHELQYMCTITPGEFNIPTNITARKQKSFNYSLTNKFSFTFTDLDYILRYLSNSINGNECWWCSENKTNRIIEDKNVDDGVEESIFDYYKTTVKYQFTSIPRLTSDILTKIQTFDLDINKDGMVTILDAKLLWKYFIKVLTIENYKSFINNYSKRTNYDEIIHFLDTNVGKGLNNDLIEDFFNYSNNSLSDPLGSYLAPYITQVGLYRNAELMAFAKLAHPIKNTGELPINIVIKCDI